MKKLTLLPLFAAVLLALAACGGATAPETTDAPPAVQSTAGPAVAEPAAGDQPLKIAALVPLSEPGAIVAGEAMRAALEIAVEEINDAGGLLGRPLELVLLDSEGLPERATAALEDTLQDEAVVGLTGVYHSAVGVAVGDLAHEWGLPVLFAEPWADAVTTAMHAEVFRIAPLSSEVSAFDAGFVASIPGVEKVVLLTENTGYGIPAAEESAAALAELGLESVTFSVEIGTEDYGDVVESVRAEAPDMIVVLATGESAFYFQQQAAEAGIGPQDLPMLCNHVSLESDAFWATVPDGNHCFVRRVGLPQQFYGDVAQAFAAKYTERTGKQEAEYYAMEAYDATWLLAKAVEAAGSTDPATLIAALEAISYDGAMGMITFPYGSANLPADSGVADKWWHQFPDAPMTVIQYQVAGQNAAVAPIVFPEEFQTADGVISGS